LISEFSLQKHQDHWVSRRLYLETNHLLKPTMGLYESVGFEHLDPSTLSPSPYARADAYGTEAALGDRTLGTISKEG